MAQGQKRNLWYKAIVSNDWERNWVSGERETMRHAREGEKVGPRVFFIFLVTMTRGRYVMWLSTWLLWHKLIIFDAVVINLFRFFRIKPMLFYTSSLTWLSLAPVPCNDMYFEIICLVLNQIIKFYLWIKKEFHTSIRKCDFYNCI